MFEQIKEELCKRWGYKKAEFLGFSNNKALWKVWIDDEEDSNLGMWINLSDGNSTIGQLSKAIEEQVVKENEGMPEKFQALLDKLAQIEN